ARPSPTWLRIALSPSRITCLIHVASGSVPSAVKLITPTINRGPGDGGGRSVGSGRSAGSTSNATSATKAGSATRSARRLDFGRVDAACAAGDHSAVGDATSGSTMPPSNDSSVSRAARAVAGRGGWGVGSRGGGGVGEVGGRPRGATGGRQWRG